MDQKKLEHDSRALFHELHKGQAEDQYIFNRLATLLNTEFLKVEPNFFEGKVCLDAGCGSNANASYNILKMGAKKVYSMDLDETIKEVIPKTLREFDGQYEITIGNVLDISFEDNKFDFTHCAGVLHHTASVEKGIRELVRVTKPGGLIYIEMYGKGGLVRDITTLFRNKYKNDEVFKKFVDALTHEDLLGFFKWTFSVMERQGDEYAKNISWKAIEQLIDKDLVLTIKDRIAAPVYHENSEEELVGWLKESGCSIIERLKRYPTIKNIRRFLCPAYFEYDSKYARILYGDGNEMFKAIKAEG